MQLPAYMAIRKRVSGAKWIVCWTYYDLRESNIMLRIEKVYMYDNGQNQIMRTVHLEYGTVPAMPTILPEWNYFIYVASNLYCNQYEKIVSVHTVQFR